MPHLDPAWELRVADHDPCDEDGKEARAVRHGGEAVDDTGDERPLRADRASCPAAAIGA